MRACHFVALSVVLLAAAAPARAQTYTFTPYETQADSIETVDFPDWSNMARCLCDQDESDPETAYFWVRIAASSNAGSDPVYFYLGDDCDDQAVSITEECYELAVLNVSDFDVDQYIPVPVHLIVDPISGECSEVNGGTSTIYALVGDINAENTGLLDIEFDTLPPGTPINVSSQEGEAAVEISWDPPDSNDEDIEFYNILCSEAGAPISGLSADHDWITTMDVCGKTLDATGTGDASETDCDSLTSGFSEGDVPNTCFVCASEITNTTTSYRVSGLTNDTEYTFAVVAVDYAGNVSSVSSSVSGIPIPTTDFAEHYRDSGGQEEGGFCFVATAVYGSYGHPRVRRLRSFRDRVLASSTLGQRFIRWYYAHGRGLARATELHPELRSTAWLGLEVGLGLATQLQAMIGPGRLPFTAGGLAGGLLFLALGLLWRVRPARRRQEVGP